MRIPFPALMLIVLVFRTARHHLPRLDRVRRAAILEPGTWRASLNVAGIAVAVGVGCYGSPFETVFAHDVEGRYANSPLKSWFESLHSGKGPCCSDADGATLSEVDWKSEDGHYLVRVEGKWWNVPDEAVINESNRAGQAMVWPVYYRELDTLVRVDIRCFIPGSMT
jgi:hypothetical protein